MENKSWIYTILGGVLVFAVMLAAIPVLFEHNTTTPSPPAEISWVSDNITTSGTHSGEYLSTSLDDSSGGLALTFDNCKGYLSFGSNASTDVVVINSTNLAIYLGSSSLGTLDISDSSNNVHIWDDSNGGVTVIQGGICLPSGTLIDTPNGQKPIESLTIGDVVWTSINGMKIAEPIEKIAQHQITEEAIKIILTDGRSVIASPGHPLTDGKTFATSTVGDLVDGSQIASIENVAYSGYTHDILPFGDSGFYWANGVLIASTLK